MAKRVDEYDDAENLSKAMTPADDHRSVETFYERVEEFVLDYDQNVEPRAISDAMLQVGITGVITKAKDLLGKRLIIYHARRFPSAFEGTEDPYFIIARDFETGEFVNTVFGGRAMLDMMRTYAAIESKHPPLVEVGYKEGGQYGGYYILK
jgi:hypothetical protein